MIIEKTQKKLIFEEAARAGIISSKILNIPELYQQILGITDSIERRYGNPSAPVYVAKPDELIRIPKLIHYFNGVTRDIKTLDVASSELEDNLILMNLEFWARAERVKARAIALDKEATTERSRAALGGVWAFTETFSKLTYVDMAKSTTWFDASEGITFLPKAVTEQTIAPNEITVLNQSIPNKASLLGSSAGMAFDGLDSTNWRCMFTANGPSDLATCQAKFKTAKNLSSVTFDPVGFGLNVILKIDKGNGLEEVTRAVIYNKTTFALAVRQVVKVEVSFNPANATLPKTVGLRNIAFYTEDSTKSASVYSTLLLPSEPFSEVKIDIDAVIPTGAKVNTYFAITSGGIWEKANTGGWNGIKAIVSEGVLVDFNEVTPSTSFGLFKVPLVGTVKPLNTGVGMLDVGRNNVEVSAFRQNWLDFGDSIRLLTLEDFKSRSVKKTWASTSVKSGLGEDEVLQYYSDVGNLANQNIYRGHEMVFQHQQSDPSFIYKELCITPLVGDEDDHTMQYDYNYRISYQVFTDSPVEIKGIYWFLQGYRAAAQYRTYRQIGKSHGSFGLYVNGTLAIGDNQPFTIFADDSLETNASVGQSYYIQLKKGWNTIDILVSVANKSTFGADSFDEGAPYLQISLYPSMFDAQMRADYGISGILASGQYSPTTEFDLLWNLPKDLTFWAWSKDLNYIYFNTDLKKPDTSDLYTIDGYFTGQYPDSYITFKGLDSILQADQIYIRLDLEKDTKQMTGPILSSYTVLTR